MNAARQARSIKAVAERAGVSIATVSRVMNGVANKASAETVARVRSAAAELDYRPISAGRALRSRQTRMVAVLASNLANPTMAAIAASAESALRDAGFVMVLCDTHDRADLQDEYLREMRSREAHAVVLLGAVRSPGLERLDPADERLIFVNRRDPLGRPAPFIGIDNAAAAAELAERLIAGDFRRIAVVHGARSSSATADRLDALCRTIAAAPGLAAPIVLTGTGGDHLAIGREATRALLAAGPLPDAVVGLSDLIAFGAHRAVVEAGIAAMPRFFGFDDNPLNDWIAPWLSSVRIPYADFGQAIVGAIRDWSHAGIERCVLLPHRLVERQGY